MNSGAPLIAALAVSMVLSACGSAAGNERNVDPNRFPAEVYSSAVYGNLNGEVRWYDTDGGAFQRAQLDTIYRDFKDLTGVPVVPDYGDGTVTKFFAAMEQGGEIPWSFIEFYSLADAHRAAKAGYLEPLDTDVVPVENVLDGGFDKYGVQRAIFGQVLAWNTDKYPEGKGPTTAADFFDQKKFPGKRCAPQYSDNGLLEQALMADGVAREDVYPLDVPRALRKLDTIKDDIIFNLSPDSQIQSLVNGECDLALAFSGRVFNAVNADHAPISMTWNGAFYAPGYMAVPKGAPNAAAGQALIAMYVTDEEANKELVSRIPYPTPLKTITLDEYAPEVQPYLPVGENVAQALQKDTAFYDEHGPEIDKQFTAWLAG
jgi:putative spermidine/putrescine transport system substrate-binding protein